MYDRTANSAGNITYNKDEDGLCWPNGMPKLVFFDYNWNLISEETARGRPSIGSR